MCAPRRTAARPHKPLSIEISYKGSLGLTTPVLHEEPNGSFHHGSVLAHEASAERVPAAGARAHLAEKKIHAFVQTDSFHTPHFVVTFFFLSLVTSSQLLYMLIFLPLQISHILAFFNFGFQKFRTLAIRLKAFIAVSSILRRHGCHIKIRFKCQVNQQ